MWGRPDENRGLIHLLCEHKGERQWALTTHRNDGISGSREKLIKLRSGCLVGPGLMDIERR